MPTYQVGAPSAVQLSQEGTGPSLVQNAGPGVVYLERATSVSPLSASLVLAPGQSVNWGGGALWAVCAAGSSATVTQLYGGDTTVTPFDGEIHGSVTVDGPVTVEGDVGVTGPVTVNGEVAVSGPVAIDGPVTVTGDVGVTGPVTVEGDVGITGTVNVNPVTIDGPVTVQGDVGIDGPVTVTGDVGVTGNVGVTGPVTVEGDVGVTGPVTVNGEVAITNAEINAHVEGNVVVDSGTVTVGGILTPVEIQGGGELLAFGGFDLTPQSGINAFVNIPIPAAVAGRMYPSVEVRVWLLTGPAGSSAKLTMRTDTAQKPVVTSLALPTTGALEFGAPFEHTFLMPCYGDNLNIQWDATHTGMRVSYVVLGSSALVAFPTTTPVPLSSASPGAAPFTGMPIYVPPSFQPMEFELVTYANTGPAGAYYEYRPNQVLTTERVWYPRNRDPATLSSGFSTVKRISGNGFAGRLSLSFATGSVVANLNHI